jgi:exodeoxyribonuclease III
MAFRNKNARIIDYKPDILIVQECENESKLKFGELTPIPNDFIWVGDNSNKGIGIFSYLNYKLELHNEFNSNFRYIIPLKVTGDRNFNLLSIWAMNSKEKYVGQIWQVMNHYQKLLGDESMLIEDFNSSTLFDYNKSNAIKKHSDVVNYLNDKNITSLYHAQYNERQGEETKPTYFIRRNIKTSYHIDYCFSSGGLVSNGSNFTIGDYKDWIDLSDHSPIIIDI